MKRPRRKREHAQPPEAPATEVPVEVGARLEDDPAAELADGLGHGRPRMGDFNSHEWAVLLPLALVGFFTNYDTGLLTLAAPDIAAGLGVKVSVFGICVAIIRLAALGSIATLRLADRWGRRTMLLISVAAFTAATGLTAAAWGLIAFVASSSSPASSLPPRRRWPAWS